MARLELAPEIVADFDRIVAHLVAHDAKDTAARIGEIVDALAVLEHSPEIGRPARDDLRELVIGRGSKSYVALYRYVAKLDTVLVLAIRAAREAGYAR